MHDDEKETVIGKMVDGVKSAVEAVKAVLPTPQPDTEDEGPEDNEYMLAGDAAIAPEATSAQSMVGSKKLATRTHRANKRVAAARAKAAKSQANNITSRNTSDKKAAFKKAASKTMAKKTDQRTNTKKSCQKERLKRGCKGTNEKTPKNATKKPKA